MYNRRISHPSGLVRLSLLVASLWMLLAGPAPATAETAQGAPNAPETQLLLGGSYSYEAATTLADIDPSSHNGKEIIVGGHTLNADGSLGCSGLVSVVRANGSLWWQAVVRASVSSAAAVGDLNGDGYGDIVVGMGAWNADSENASNECGKGDPNLPGNGGVVALNGQSGAVLWVFDTSDWGEWGSGPNGVLDGVYSSPAIGDVNADGYLEVAFAAWDDCIYLVDHTGQSLWGRVPFNYDPWFCNQRGFFNHDTDWSSPALADLDGDGRLEIIVGGDISCTDVSNPDLCNYYGVPNGGFLWVIKADGSYLARRWFDQAVYSSPAIADLEGDGVLDIVVGTGSGFPGKGYYITAWSLNPALPAPDALVLKWKTDVVGRTFSSPAIGDLNGDGILDVTMVIKYGEWGVPVGYGPNTGSYVYGLRGDNGSVLWRTHACNNDSIGRSFPVNASTVMAPIAGDSRPKIFFPTAWQINALNADGTYYTRVNNANGCSTSTGSADYSGNPAMGGGFYATAALDDIDGDGQIELVAAGRWDEESGSNTGVLYIWEVGTGGTAPWPMFRHDAAHSGMIDNVAPTNPSGVTSTPPPSETVLDSFMVSIQWAQPGRDFGSGLAGYSVLWDQSPATTADTAVDYPAGTITLTHTITGGRWYAHIRSVDRAGNGAASTVHIGPFIVDATPPTNPSSISATPAFGDAWHKPQTVSVYWAIGGSDPDSGLAGYSIVWDEQPSTLPDAVVDIGPAEMGIASVLGNGIWYAHVRAVDRAGNAATTAVHVGPFRLDGISPQSQASSPPMVVQSAIPITWTGTDAGGSGIAQYVLQVRTGEQGVWMPWATSAAAGSAVFDSAAPCGATLNFRAIATDRAGNTEDDAKASESTTFVASPYTISGQVLNNSGQPVYNAHISSTSACAGTSSNLAGRFTVYYAAPATATLEISRTGFGALPPLESRATGGENVALIMPPADDAIQNGDFETGNLTGWSAIHARVIGTGYSGGYAAQLTGTGQLEQVVSVGPDAVLSLVYSISHAAQQADVVRITATPDEASDRISGATAIQMVLPLNASGWNHATMNLDGLANQRARITIDVQSASIDARFDEVTLGTSMGGVFFAHLPLVLRR